MAAHEKRITELTTEIVVELVKKLPASDLVTKRDGKIEPVGINMLFSSIFDNIAKTPIKD